MMCGQSTISQTVTPIEMEEVLQANRNTNWARRVEESGASRIDEDSRHIKTYTASGVFRFWFGYNFNWFNITLGMIGPLEYLLSTEKAVLMALLAVTCGSIPVGLVACLGPPSRLRTVIINRFIFGWIPAKALSFLVMTLLVGYSMVDIIAAGNLMSALMPESELGATLAIIILGCLAITIAVYGIDTLQTCQQWIWFPQLLAVCVLVGVFLLRIMDVPENGSTQPLADSPTAYVGYFSLIFSATLSYSMTAADCWVYCSANTPRNRLSFGTVGGLWASGAILIGLGIALGSVTRHIAGWETAYEKNPGELLKTVAPVGLPGTICVISFALGSIAGATGGMYGFALAVQSISGRLESVTRAKWTAIGGIVSLATAIAGKDSLVEVLQNFVAIDGYCVSVWITIFGWEHFLFRRGQYAWEKCDLREFMPKGYAASLAFAFGVTVAILSMAQAWYVGPIARLGVEDGINVRSYVRE